MTVDATPLPRSIQNLFPGLANYLSKARAIWGRFWHVQRVRQNTSHHKKGPQNQRMSDNIVAFPGLWCVATFNSSLGAVYGLGG